MTAPTRLANLSRAAAFWWATPENRYWLIGSLLCCVVVAFGETK